MHNDIKVKLLPYSGLPRITRIEDIGEHQSDDDFISEFIQDFPAMADMLLDEYESIDWDNDHSPETLAALNLNDTGLFIDNHREGIREEAKVIFFNRRKG